MLLCSNPGWCGQSSRACEFVDDATVAFANPEISYFNRDALEGIFLPSPVHSKYINKAVLDRFMPVGGVRIEDDLLITSKGWENLTTAPKGEAALKIIRGEA